MLLIFKKPVGVYYVMDNSCCFNRSLVAGTRHVLYSRWICSHSTGDCNHYHPDQSDQWEKADHLITVRNCTIAGNKRGRAKYLHT